MLLYRYLFAIS